MSFTPININYSEYSVIFLMCAFVSIVIGEGSLVFDTTSTNKNIDIESI